MSPIASSECDTSATDEIDQMAGTAVDTHIWSSFLNPKLAHGQLCR